MRIRVILLQDVEGVGVRGQTVEIEQDAFDEALHLREHVEPTGPATIGEMEPGAFAESIAVSVGGALRTVLADAGVGRVDPNDVLIRPGGNRGGDRGRDNVRPYGSAGRAIPAWEFQYTQLEPWEREIRSPESDYDIQRFFIAHGENDRETLREIAERYSPGAEEAWQRAALAEGGATTGGNIVPVPMSNLIVAKRGIIEQIGPLATQYTSANQTLEVPAEGTVMTAAGVAEAGAIPENDPTLDQVVLTKKKAAAATRSSRELLFDTPFNLVSVLSDQAGRALAVYNDAQDANDGDGAGTNQTDSLDNNSSISVVDAAVGTLVLGDVTAIFYALKAQYRRFAHWICNGDVLQTLTEITDSNGQQIFTNAGGAAAPLAGGQGSPGVPTLLTRPLIESEGMPGLGASPAGILFFGDLSQYAVLQDGPIRVESSDQAAFLADQIIWKFVQRRDGAVIQAEAFKKSRGITG